MDANPDTFLVEEDRELRVMTPIVVLSRRLKARPIRTMMRGIPLAKKENWNGGETRNRLEQELYVHHVVAGAQEGVVGWERER